MIPNQKLQNEKKDPVIIGTLEWCNERRAEQGMEPLLDLPMGQKEEPLSCPCGEATGLYVDGSFYCTAEEARGGWAKIAPEDKKKLPFDVQNFVHEFDLGTYPQYDVNEGDDPAYD